MPARRRAGPATTGGSIEFDGVRELARAFGSMPADVRRELRPKLVAAARLVADRAKQTASWSTRIPGAISVGASTSAKSGGARVRVSAAKAPHARAFEGIADRRPTFRHPVFGDKNNWVAQPSRPFLAPAAAEMRGQARELVREAVRSVTTRRSPR